MPSCGILLFLFYKLFKHKFLDAVRWSQKKTRSGALRKKVFVLKVNILDNLTRVCPDIAPYSHVVVSKFLFFIFECLLSIIFSCSAKKTRMQMQTRVWEDDKTTPTLVQFKSPFLFHFSRTMFKWQLNEMYFRKLFSLENLAH